MPQTVIEKIAQLHMLSGPSERPVRAGDVLTIRPRHVMTHDNTAAVLNKFEGIGARRVHDASQPVFTLDHNIQDRSAGNLAKYKRMEAFAAQQGISFYPAGAGIGHQMMIENGHVLPGSFVVASDSHANMYGAMGALGTPVVRTDAAAIWASGEFWWQVPRTVLLKLHGRLAEGATGKDVILALCGLYNQGELLNAAVEFGGPGVASLSMDARMTIANMTTEWGALAGWFPVDALTLDYLRSRRDRGAQRITEEALEAWARQPPVSDPGAHYAARIVLDLAEVTPRVSGPDSVQVTACLAEIEAQKIPVHKAYLLSCVNSRFEDLAAAAQVLEGGRIAEGVAFYVAAASQDIEKQAREAGLWKIFEEAGAEFLPPGCGPCIGLGRGLLEAGENGISATNRNFKGRMGSREARCYLASPAVVAASARAGVIRGPQEWSRREITRHFETFDELAPGGAAEVVEILSGFPERLSGRLVFLPQDNLNTDGIYSKDYTYREDVSPEEMARVVMENYDPTFASRVMAGDVVVGRWNFGTGSSREQAVTALQAKGVPLVIAGSFSQTYLRNAFNNGFLCVACPDFVRRVDELLAEEAAGERSVISEDDVTIDFAASRITWRGESFGFPVLGPVPQALVVAGGVEKQLRHKLGLA